MRRIVVLFFVSLLCIACESTDSGTEPIEETLEIGNLDQSQVSRIALEIDKVEKKLKVLESGAENKLKTDFVIGTINETKDMVWSSENTKLRTILMSRLDLLHQEFLIDDLQFDLVLNQKDSSIGYLMSKSQCNLTGLYVSYGAKVKIISDGNSQQVVLGRDSCTCSSECSTGCNVDPAIHPCSCTPCSGPNDGGKKCKKTHTVIEG